MKKLILFLSLVPFSLLGQDNNWNLKKCIDYAISKNIAIKEVQLDVAVAESNYLLAKSKRLPNLNFGINQRLNNGTSIDPITSDFVNQNILSSTGGLNTQMPLFSGFQITNEIKQTELLIKQSSLKVEEANNSIMLDVLESYLQVLYNKENITVAKNDLNLVRETLAQIKKKYEAGVLTISSLTDATTQVAVKEYSLVIVENEYVQQLSSLKQLLELGGTENFDIENEFKMDSLITVLPEKQALYESALKSLPELEAIALQLEIDNAGLLIAKSGYYPNLSLSGGLSTGYTSSQMLSFGNQLSSNFNSSLGLSLNIPIFNRNETKVLTQKAKLNIESSDLQVISLKKSLYSEVENVWQNSKAVISQVKAAKVAEYSAKQSYELAQKQFELGDLNVSELIVYQNTYLNAKQSYLQSKYLGVLNQLLLDFYQGKELSI